MANPPLLRNRLGLAILAIYLGALMIVGAAIWSRYN